MAYDAFYEVITSLYINRAKIPACTSKLIVQNHSYSSDTVALFENKEQANASFAQRLGFLELINEKRWWRGSVFGYFISLSPLDLSTVRPAAGA